MKKFDRILIIGILLVAGAFWGMNEYRVQQIEKNSSGLKAEISVEGKLYKVVPLTGEEQEFTIETDHGKNVVKVHDQGIEIIDADCPDKVCVDMPLAMKPGEMVVCLPHKIIIEVKGERKEEIDGLSN